MERKGTLQSPPLPLLCPFVDPNFIAQPTITTLDSTDHPVWQINFPGVTVCPANKVVEEKLAKVVEQQP